MSTGLACGCEFFPAGLASWGSFSRSILIAFVEPSHVSPMDAMRQRLGSGWMLSRFRQGGVLRHGIGSEEWTPSRFHALQQRIGSEWTLSRFRHGGRCGGYHGSDVDALEQRYHHQSLGCKRDWSMKACETHPKETGFRHVTFRTRSMKACKTMKSTRFSACDARETL